MILIQIWLGGVTRLTDSGLSITEWKVISGTLPPLNEAEWNQVFEKYKIAARTQFNAIHASMTLAEFKKIFFWEYIHRLWARFMGFVFLIPFFIFYFQKKISPWLLKRLGIVILLASLSAIFGWLMVASGLNNDKRTWVNAYNLLIHLLLATSLYGYLLYTFYLYSFRNISKLHWDKKVWIYSLGILILVQICLGALMSGMKAALIFPYSFIWLHLDAFQAIMNSVSVNYPGNLYDYEPNIHLKLWVQIFHRVIAWSIVLVTLFIAISNKKYFKSRTSLWLLIFCLILQIALGLLTVMNSIGKIPITLGALHQIMAFLLLSVYLWIYFRIEKV